MCQCHQIGGPFVAEDPNGPTHGVGGSGERIDELQQQVYDLERQLDVVSETVAVLIRKVARLENSTRGV